MISKERILDRIPKGAEPCDAGCGKPATEWFGGTSCATCGSEKCVRSMQREAEQIRKDYDEERGFYS